MVASPLSALAGDRAMLLKQQAFPLFVKGELRNDTALTNGALRRNWHISDHISRSNNSGQGEAS
jgi:hypothetical protein